MANTTIQLKYSLATVAPATLNVGEPAYSFASNTLFIGTPGSDGAIAIGGRFYLDQQQHIYDYANAAFAQANSAGSSALVQYAAAHANAAYNQANTNASDITVIQGVNLTQNTNITNAQNKADSSFHQANAAYNLANTNASDITVIQGVNLTQNTNITNAQNSASAAFNQANASYNLANTNASDITVIQGVNLTQNTNITNAQNTADAAYTRANNSLNANTGGTIAGDVSITGNLSVLGNTFSVSTTQIVANDTMFILGVGNYTSDILDIGFASHYNAGTNAHTGFIRDAGTKEWQLFEGYTPDIGANNQIDINDPSFKIATLNANLHSQFIQLNGQDLQKYVNESFNKANASYNQANTTQTFAGEAFHKANAAYNQANTNASDITVIQGVNLTQNTNITNAQNKADSAFHQANAAYGQANTNASDITVIQGVNLSQNTNITNAQNKADSAFHQANSAYDHANAAFNTANTDVTNVNITSADYGSATGVASFKVAANGRIISANTTTIALDASAITSGTLSVARGGTGAGTHTLNGVLLGQGTSAFTTASSSTEGHVLTINNSGVPTFAHLSGGTF